MLCSIEKKNAKKGKGQKTVTRRIRSRTPRSPEMSTRGWEEENIHQTLSSKDRLSVQEAKSLVAESAGSAAVVHAALGDGAAGAGGAGGNILPDDGAVVADTELGAAVADDGTIGGASSGSRAAGGARAGLSTGATSCRSGGGWGRGSWGRDNRRGSGSRGSGSRSSRGSGSRGRGCDSGHGSWDGGRSRGSCGRDRGLRCLGGGRRGRRFRSGRRRASSTAVAGRSLGVVGTTVLEGRTRVGELDCLVQRARAGGGSDVGDEHVGKSIETGSIAGATRDIDGSAVHVEFGRSRHLCEP